MRSSSTPTPDDDTAAHARPGAAQPMQPGPDPQDHAPHAGHDSPPDGQHAHVAAASRPTSTSPLPPLSASCPSELDAKISPPHAQPESAEAHQQPVTNANPDSQPPAAAAPDPAPPKAAAAVPGATSPHPAAASSGCVDQPKRPIGSLRPRTSTPSQLTKRATASSSHAAHPRPLRPAGAGALPSGPAAPQNLLQLVTCKTGRQPQTCNLRGAVLTWPLGSSQPYPDVMQVTCPGLRLSNGTLLLPPGACICVAAQHVHLSGINIKGAARTAASQQASQQAQAGPGAETAAGLVTVAAGASLEMHNCSVELSRQPDNSSRTPGVLVCGEPQRPAEAHLVLCTISRCSGDGVRAVGPGSTVYVHKCVARKNEGAGFRAVAGGQVLATESTAQGNGKAGFTASGAHSHVTTGSNCVSDENMTGYLAVQGGEVSAGEHNKASSNQFNGFDAYGHGSLVTVNAHSVAEGNKNNGFSVWSGGHMQVRGNCTARSNQFNGYSTKGDGTRLQIGNFCSAVSNRASGFYVHMGTQLLGGNGCTARANLFSGFVADGAGARLELGTDCVASANAMSGIFAQAGAQVIAGTGSCDQDGRVHAAGLGSYIRLGQFVVRGQPASSPAAQGQFGQASQAAAQVARSPAGTLGGVRQAASHTAQGAAQVAGAAGGASSGMKQVLGMPSMQPSSNYGGAGTHMVRGAASMGRPWSTAPQLPSLPLPPPARPAPPAQQQQPSTPMLPAPTQPRLPSAAVPCTPRGRAAKHAAGQCTAAAPAGPAATPIPVAGQVIQVIGGRKVLAPQQHAGRAPLPNGGPASSKASTRPAAAAAITRETPAANTLSQSPAPAPLPIPTPAPIPNPVQHQPAAVPAAAASISAPPFPAHYPYLPPHLALAFGGRPWAASDPGSLQQQQLLPPDAAGTGAVPLVTAALHDLSVRAGVRSISHDGGGGAAVPAAAAAAAAASTALNGLARPQVPSAMATKASVVSGRPISTSTGKAQQQPDARAPSPMRLLQCAVCKEGIQSDARAAFAPCGHVECCVMCAADMIAHSKPCPACKQPATGLMWIEQE